MITLQLLGLAGLIGCVMILIAYTASKLDAKAPETPAQPACQHTHCCKGCAR